MGKAVLEVSAGFLPELVPLLATAVKIVGSEQCNSGNVRFVIEGECVPNNAPSVTCEITKAMYSGRASLTFRFKPIMGA